MNNDQEWRQHLFDEIKELRKDVSLIKQEMVSLKLKIGAFSSFVGATASYLWSKIF